MTRSLLPVTLFCASLLVLAGCASPIVGAKCREGFDEVNGFCVGRDTGVPDGSLDGDIPDGDTDGDMDGGMDADDADGDMRDVMDFDGDPNPDSGDGGDGSMSTSCEIGERLCGTECVQTDRDPLHCGQCFSPCPDDQLCAAGECVVTCEAPLVLCRGLCILLDENDPDNCGSCGTVCPTGICEAGECIAARSGHVVVIGHDYTTRRTAMNRVAGNSVFIGRGNPVRVLAYAADAPVLNVMNVDIAIGQVATETGRMWSRTVSIAEEVPERLLDADVFVVYPQTNADDATLEAAGDLWSTALSQFLARGGVIVLFEGPSGHNGTYQILERAGLFTASGVTVVTGDDVDVIEERSSDAVVVDVPLSYRAQSNSVRFDSLETSAVITHEDGPVVFHTVVLP